MMIKIRKESSDISGFTLIEIAVAITVFALGFTTLVALQTSAVDSYQKERNINQAALYAQYLLTMIEVQPEPPQLDSQSGNLVDILDEYGFFEYEFKSGDIGKEQLEGWKYELETTSVPIGIVEDVLRKVELDVSWSEVSSDTFKLILYVYVNKEFRGL